jgi:transglutaminase-like putative cysteine protease
MAVEKLLQILASLVALIGIAPAYLYLDPFAQLVSLVGLVVGFVSDRRKGQLLPSFPATLLSCIFFGTYLLQMSRDNIVEPLINLLVVLLAVRLVTKKNGRNLLQIFVLSTFVLAASSLLSLSAAYLVCLVLLIALVTYGLLLTSFYATAPDLHLNRHQWRSLVFTGAILPVGSLLLMLFFFGLLPRTEHPLWNFLNPGANSTAGFSEVVNPGSLANLGSSGAPAFRAEMRQIDPLDLYWRGLVLNRTDGRRWSRDRGAPADISPVPGKLSYTQVIYLQPRKDRYLPGLDLESALRDIRHSSSSDGVFEARQRQNRTSHYRVESSPESRLQLKDPTARDYYLQIPAQTGQRLRTIAAELSRQPDTSAKIQAGNDFFMRQKLSYSASNLQISETPVETFLFDSKRGYCEYFASAYALLLRMAGVPTRLVGGYLGGRYNELGGYYLVDEDMAHVWVEALDDQNRWQRIDPSRLAINAGVAVNGLARLPFNWSQSISDFIDTAWSRLVITYDLQRQFGLLLATGQRLRSIRPDLAGGYPWWVLGLILISLVGFSAKWQRHRPNPRQRLLQRYLRSLNLTGDRRQIPQALGLYALAAWSQNPLCHEFARIYGAAYYQEQELSSQELKRLKQIIRQLSRARICLDPASAPRDLAQAPHNSIPAKIDKRLKIP